MSMMRRFDTPIEVVQANSIPDGMGGSVVTLQTINQITGLITPIETEVALKEHGIVSTTAMRVFTKDNVPNKLVQLRIDGNLYRILEHIDFHRVRRLLVELI